MPVAFSCLTAVAAVLMLCIAGCGASHKQATDKTASAKSAKDPTPTPTPTASVAWPAPKLDDPTVIDLTSTMSSGLNLNPAKDYILRLPRGRVLNVPYGFTITGGHNVVMIGGTLNVERASGVMTLNDQTGTVHIEGVRFTGPHLLEGFDLSESKGATVEFERVYVDTVHGSQSTNHADLIQTWAGPRRLLVDGFMGSTQYQGFFLLPNQHYNGPPPQQFDLRNVYIDDHGGYAVWLQSTPKVPVHVSNLYVTPPPTKTWSGWWLMPKPSGNGAWDGAHAAGSAPLQVTDLVRPAGVSYQ